LRVRTAQSIIAIRMILAMPRVLITLTVCLVLGGCASSQRLAVPVQSNPRLMAWDGLGPDPSAPRKPQRARAAAPDDRGLRERETVLSTLRPYTTAWWIVHDEIEAERDAGLGKKLVICRGCMVAAPDAAEVTGSTK
jgi:hypothetical protein